AHRTRVDGQHDLVDARVEVAVLLEKSHEKTEGTRWGVPSRAIEAAPRRALESHVQRRSRLARVARTHPSESLAHHAALLGRDAARGHLARETSRALDRAQALA